jgi:hypothetical protein
MQPKQVSELAPGCLEPEASVSSPLVSIGKENLAQKRGINKGYAIKNYDEIACVPCRLCQSCAHGREIIFGPIADKLEDFRRSAPIVLQLRLR